MVADLRQRTSILPLPFYNRRDEQEPGSPMATEEDIRRNGTETAQRAKYRRRRPGRNSNTNSVRSQIPCYGTTASDPPVRDRNLVDPETIDLHGWAGASFGGDRSIRS